MKKDNFKIFKELKEKRSKKETHVKKNIKIDEMLDNFKDYHDSQKLTLVEHYDRAVDHLKKIDYSEYDLEEMCFYIDDFMAGVKDERVPNKRYDTLGCYFSAASNLLFEKDKSQKIELELSDFPEIRYLGIFQKSGILKIRYDTTSMAAYGKSGGDLHLIGNQAYSVGIDMTGGTLFCDGPGEFNFTCYKGGNVYRNGYRIGF